jgi:hypothetical protein
MFLQLISSSVFLIFSVQVKPIPGETRLGLQLDDAPGQVMPDIMDQVT